jgi:hypothetical protein
VSLWDVARTTIAGWVNHPTRRHWGAWADAVALTLDVLAETAELARVAALPGQVDGTIAPNLGGYENADALALIGEDCQVLRGLGESDADYALRLRRYRDDWRRAGSAFGLLEAVAGALTTSGDPPPLLRIFTHGTGRWYTREADGTMRLQTAQGDGFALAPDGTCTPDATAAQVCDWDSAADPHPPGWNDSTRFFLVIYCPTNLPWLAAISGTLGDGRAIGEGKGTPDASTFGTTSVERHVELTRGVVLQRRAVGYKCAKIITAFDPTSFAPDGSSSTYPDGTWGWTCKVVAGQMMPARDLSARYWNAEPGGIAGSA